MTPILTLFDRRKTQTQTIEDHLSELRTLMSEHAGCTKAVTVLIDEHNGQWQIHPVYCNTTNGDVFMALALLKQNLLKGVHNEQ
jgi:hypothetical protein